MDQGFYKNYHSYERNHWWSRVRENLIFRLLDKYSKREKSGIKILDFGCASGHLVGELQKRGYNAFGIDADSQSINFGLSEGIKNLSVAEESQITFPDNSLDFLLALDVIEHLPDERPAIKEFERVLKPGAVAIITVPSYQWLWGVQDDIAHHYRRYTVGSLVEVLNKNTNLQILRETYFNTFLFPPIAVVRVLSKWFNLKKRESDFDINNKWLNKMFFFIFDLERKVLKYINFPFGVSILLVAKKNDNYSQK